jgi:D-glycero-D-manno-heptose 1,7-bisphosphate phosphatase
MKLVIFDLDGTLTPQRPSSTASFKQRLLPGVAKKCKSLRDGGAILAIATNQGGLRKGLPQPEVDRVLSWVGGKLRIPAPLRKFEGWPGPRKKPNPGMLLELMRQTGCSAAETLFVGDSDSDRQAAANAACSFAWASKFFSQE